MQVAKGRDWSSFGVAIRLPGSPQHVMMWSHVIEGLAMSMFERIALQESTSHLSAPIYEALYEAVKLYPSQKKLDHVFSKLILVGRVLGVSMERRTVGLRVQDAKTVLSAAELIVKSRLQGMLRRIDSNPQDPVEVRAQVVSCHRLLEDVMSQCGAKNSAELAAAYLHAHRAHAFPLMGAQARIGAKLFLESQGAAGGVVARVTRPDGYQTWLAVVDRAMAYLESRTPAKQDLLQLNQYLEQWSLSEE